MAQPNPEPIDVQSLSRSCNEILILATLSFGPHHGYQLALEIEEKSGGVFRFQHGTLYPILHRLEREGRIQGDWIDNGGRKRRKSYRLTPAGRRELASRVAAWKSFFERLFRFVEGGRP